MAQVPMDVDLYFVQGRWRATPDEWTTLTFTRDQRAMARWNTITFRVHRRYWRSRGQAFAFLHRNREWVDANFVEIKIVKVEYAHHGPGVVPELQSRVFAMIFESDMPEQWFFQVRE